MDFQIAYHTDAGSKKEVNQDSLGILEAETEKGTLLMAILCDGMGGLEKGEVASATLVREFEKWFQKELPVLLVSENPLAEIRYGWERMIKTQNLNIAEYGRQYHIQMGSTLTVLLFMESGTYLIGHVGDSRAYVIRNEGLDILTQDQTVAANEVRLGKMTAEEAAADARKSVLLQCIGASGIVEPDFIEGQATPGECYMLCSDGFRNKVSEEEIQRTFAPEKNVGEEIMKENAKKLVALNMERGEQDNISVVLLKLV